MSCILINNIKIGFYTQKETISRIEHLIEEKKTHQIVTLNLLMYLNSKRDKYSYQALKNASFVLPDSIGIVLSVFLVYGQLYKRVPGIEILFNLLERVKEKKYIIFFLGAKENIIKNAVKNIEDAYNIKIAGYNNGYFDGCDDKIINKINNVSPDILFVGLSTEKQEKWISSNLNKLRAKIVMGVGGSFDILSGCISRAPKIFLWLGLEWYFRLLREPWRIKRIIKLPIAFIIFFYDTLKSIRTNKKNFR